MEYERFVEYESIIRESLELVKFPETTIILPGSFSTKLIFVRTAKCKNCIIEAEMQHILVLAGLRFPYFYQDYNFEVVNRIDLAEPGSLEYLGATIVSVLIRWS